MKWLTAPMDPRNLNLMMAPLNPAMYTGWMGATVDPRSYGSMGAFINPATYGAMVPQMAPQGTAPAPIFNPFDPALWSQMMPAPVAPAPAAPAPAAPAPAAPAQ
jgi:hypothetical protein